MAYKELKTEKRGNLRIAANLWRGYRCPEIDDGRGGWVERK